MCVCCITKLLQQQNTPVQSRCPVELRLYPCVFVPSGWFMHDLTVKMSTSSHKDPPRWKTWIIRLSLAQIKTVKEHQKYTMRLAFSFYLEAPLSGRFLVSPRLSMAAFIRWNSSSKRRSFFRGTVCAKEQTWGGICCTMLDTSKPSINDRILVWKIPLFPPKSSPGTAPKGTVKRISNK